MRNIYRLIKLLPTGRRLFIISSILITLEGISGSLIPLVIRNLTNAVYEVGTKHGQASSIINPLVILGVLSLLAAGLDWVASLASDRLQILLSTNLRVSIFERLSSLSIDYFERTRVGEILQKISTAINDVLGWVQQAGNFLFINVVNLVVALVILTKVDWQVAAIMATASAITMVFQIRLIRDNREIYRQSRAITEQALGVGNETLAQVSTIRSFGQEAVRLAHMSGLLRDAKGLEWKTQVRTERSFFSRQVLLTLARILSLGIVALAVLHGKQSPGDIVLVTLYLTQITGNVIPIGRLIVNTGQAEASALRITEVLDEKPTLTDRPNAIDLDHLKTLEFRKVTFRYPGKQRRVLNNVSFKLAAGQTLALVGPSGVGKTTITKLLLRFYEPSEGQILINGRDIGSYTQASVRNLIGMVMQDVALFNESIEENLRFARAGATNTELRQAAQLAHADVFIEKLPDKYKTMVGERGIKLSGGEKQRVAVARAILRNPELIILDEATSALDSESERFVQDGLRQLMTGKTAVVIAHRLSTVMQADQIVVLKDGKVLERGDHAKLVNKKSGLYARLFALQQGGNLT